MGYNGMRPSSSSSFFFPALLSDIAIFEFDKLVGGGGGRREEGETQGRDVFFPLFFPPSDIVIISLSAKPQSNEAFLKR